MNKPQEALNQYVAAAQEWQALRTRREAAKQQLAALLTSEVKPADYSGQLDAVRERLEVLEWQINCASREGVYAQGMVLGACVEDGLNTFMAENGSALTAALAPFLNGRGGMEVEARVLRTALARQAEVGTPEPAEAYRDIIAGSGLFPDATMSEDCQQGYTTAQHFRFQRRLAKLGIAQGAHDMALKCPECGEVAHTRTSAYESATVKRTWYQCQNIECSCTFTALESVEKIIIKPGRTNDAGQLPEPPERKPQVLGRYGSGIAFQSASRSPSEHSKLTPPPPPRRDFYAFSLAGQPLTGSA